jgi:hypothetical protein
MQDADDFDASFSEGSVKNDVILEIGAAEAGSEIGSGMSCSIVKGEMLDSILNLSNPAFRLKFTVAGDVGPNLIEIGQDLERTPDDWLHAARAALAWAFLFSARNCSTSKSSTNSP